MKNYHRPSGIPPTENNKWRWRDSSKFKTLFLSAFIFLAIGTAASYFYIYKKIIKPVFAQENEVENEDDEDQVMKVVDTNPQKKEAKPTETKTIYERLSDTVTRQTITTTKFDSDGDGILDEEDAHPTINDYFIVKDDNLNGIDDRYEQ